MRKFLLTATAAASMFAVGCTSPESVCETTVNTMCDKVFECGSSENKAGYGTGAEDCKTKMTAAARCSELEDYDEFCTGQDAGKKFDLGNALDCQNAIEKLSCTDYNDGRFPSVCEQVCK